MDRVTLVDRPGVQTTAAIDHLLQQGGIDQAVLGHQGIPALLRETMQNLCAPVGPALARACEPAAD